MQVPEHEQGCSSGGDQDQAPSLEGHEEQPADVSAPEQALEGGLPEARQAADGGNAQLKRVAALEDLERAASLKVCPVWTSWLSELCLPLSVRQAQLSAPLNQSLACNYSGVRQATLVIIFQRSLLHAGICGASDRGIPAASLGGGPLRPDQVSACIACICHMIAPARESCFAPHGFSLLPTV